MRPPPDEHDLRQARQLERAFRWLVEVNGRLLCKRDEPEAEDGWVAIVKTPAAPGHGAQLILGFGDSALSAVETAQERWDSAWREISAIH
jgi:hypothetical protein